MAARTDQRLEPDASRVLARLFVAGQEEVGPGESRASGVVERILALDNSEVEQSLADVLRRFDHRHKNLSETFRHNADRVSNRIAAAAHLSASRRLLLGATFTQLSSVEGAAVCNPSAVLHPDQGGVAAGAARFIMSVRGIGEGHHSSIGFRTGEVDAKGTVLLRPAAPFPVTGIQREASHERDVFHGRLRELGDDGENAAFVFDTLAERFSTDELEHRLGLLHGELDTRRNAEDTIARIRAIAMSSYSIQFPADTDVSERVLWPSSPPEAQGMEDARFVRFIDDDGTVTYYATYTAFDGVHISQHLLETVDFATFTATPIVGAAAANKGLALFPRRIGRRFVALSRSDRENNAVAFSDNIRRWDWAVPFQGPSRVWETIQLGNCGSPIETDAGWLVLTHGVGPIRTYSIGAVLLDLDDPSRVIGRLADPLLSPAIGEEDGYVPNVVYSCGALLHGATLVIPFGIADTAIRVATVAVSDLLAALSADRHSNHHHAASSQIPANPAGAGLLPAQ